MLGEAVRRAEERQHPGLQESREEKKKRGSHYAQVGLSRSSDGNRETKCHRWMRTSRRQGQRCQEGPEEPLMEPCFILQRGVFNQCDCPTFSICLCVCLPLEPEGGLLMAAAMAMVVMVVVMMMRWQWCCSHGFWLSSPYLLKDSLR